MFCKEEATFFEVMQKINENVKGIAFIIDDARRLKGIMTDGDIRRALLGGCKLNDGIRDHINTNFVHANVHDSYEDMYKKVSSKIKIIPVVDDDFHVVDIFELHGIFHVPVADPDLRGNEFKYLLDAFLSSWISSRGQYILDFEKNFSDFCSCAHGVAVSNGTVAIHLALEAMNIPKGSEVIVPDLTFAATINAVLHANLKPVIVDIERDSWCIDPAEIEKAITPKIKAIIPVHIYGQPCDMGGIMDIARRHDLRVIEDCAEAHGALYDGRKVGCIGDIGCFSFFANKVITTGEGGMCVTNSDALDDRLRLLRDHGMSKTKKYWHESIGYNYRMTNLQAAIGLAQLERIDDIIEKRRMVESIYKEKLSSLKMIEFQRDDLPLRKKITWLVSLLIKNGKRDYYIEKLKNNGIDSRPFFYPLSLMDIYKPYVFSNTNSLIISKEGINLPTSHNLETDKMEKIYQLLNE